MPHRALSNFWFHYRQLPDEIQDLADRCFRLLRDDPSHPSLRLKKVGDLWSARIGRNYRALAIEDENGLTWTWIGRHDEYERLIRG